MTNGDGRFTRLLLTAITSGLICLSANAAVEVLGVQYRPDQVFSEYDCYWHDSNYPTSCQTNRHGATIHVYVKNTGASAVTINDATLAGYSLKTVIKMSEASWNPDQQNSIYFNWDNPPGDILAAGEPVWYRFDPPSIPPGGVAQAAVRLRSVPTTPSVALGIVTSAGTAMTNITVDAHAPQIASLGYSEDLRNIYVHWRRASGGGSSGAAPAAVWLNGSNVTSLTTTVGDPSLDFAASVISLPNALPFFSYNVFQGVYADGKMASASQRAWTNKFIYATYGNFELTANYTAADWITEATDHGVNNCQVNFGEVGQYMNTVGGAAYAKSRGFGYTIGDKTKLNVRGIDPDMWFLNDEPDAEEQNQSNNHCGTGLRVPCGGEHSAGTLVIKTVANGESEQRALRPLVPLIVNLDNALKPESYFTWGPAMDILQFDNYYQRRLSDAYWRFPRLIPLYRKATYIYAHARIGSAGAEPNPSNQLLYSCEWKCDYEDCGANQGNVWPFPTPESKRIEVYYSLAGGSKGLGYWWFPKGWPSNGLADQGKATARAVWKEMGLLGNEIKTARPLIVTSTPVDLPLAPGSNVWARALASGTNSIILYVVNDDYYNDFTGCHYNPVSNATVTATLPSWMVPPTAFEVTPAGLRDVSTQLNGNQLQVNLGTLKLTRMIILTTDPQLRTTLQQRYDQSVRPGICNFAPEFCTNSPPSISQQPANRTVPPGGTTNFTVVASGTGTLGYRWQKNNSNLNNGGHYAGATTGTLTISTADANDAANYRCVVTNAYGSVTSSIATLTVTNFISPPIITQQPSNQGTDVGGTANFTVSAIGTEPLSYQWQENNSNLSNAGHYTGVTTSTLTITGADANDAASYRCVVTNIYGSTNSASATLTVNLNLCRPGVLLRHGDMEDASAWSLCPDWQSYSAGNGVASWAKETVIIHGGAAAQRARNINGATGSLLGIRQTFDANIGDAFTFSGWVYPASQPAYQQVALVARWDGSTANPAPGSGTWNISTGVRQVWAQIQNLSGNATATNVTLFLDSRRVTGSIEITAYWDDVVCYRAYVPPAPIVSAASSTSLNVDLLPGCNTNSAAQFALSIGGGAYTLGTHWLQADGTVNTTPVWLADAAWNTKTVTGLTTGTPYTFKVRARYSSALPQPTSLGTGATLTPLAAQTPPQLSGQRSGNNLILTWPESPSAHLERAASLSPPIGWATATNQVTTVNGRKSVTLTPTGNAGYYRLALE